jgi:hypothetical protein
MIFKSQVKPKLIVEGIRIKKCQNCGDSRIRDGHYINGNCPNCGAKLPEVENLGVLYDSSWWWHMKQKIKKLFITL